MIPPSVTVVGPGGFFRSGITYYTYELCNSLAERGPTTAILLRRLIPERLYPGRKRIGESLSDLTLDERVEAYDGVDWYWFPSLGRALSLLWRRNSDFVVFEWWTSTALHTYLALALAARASGASLVIEFHEALDTSEARLRPVRLYAKAVAPLLFRMSAAFVVHSTFDDELVRREFNLPDRPMVTIPHAAYAHYRGGRVTRPAPPGVSNILYFGVIRPFKGVEDLVRAFDLIPESEIEEYWLTIVGEPWEGWRVPQEMIRNSRYRHRITFVDRYVTDVEVDGFFGGADVVALPYHRSSQSGPLHVAFAYGLPVVVTNVGGLVEAATPYEGAILVEPRSPHALLEGIRQASSDGRRRFASPANWDRTSELYERCSRGLPSKGLGGVRRHGSGTSSSIEHVLPRHQER